MDSDFLVGSWGPYTAAPIWLDVFASPQIGDEALITHTLALLKGAMEP
jgi:hypothetical protein